MSPLKAAKKQTDRNECDRLCSQLVRARGACERCGLSDYEKLQAAHIIRRRYAATRVEILNLWALCGLCHYQVDNFADEFMKLVEGTIGVRLYFALKAKAEATTKVDWKARRAELAALVAQLEVA